MLDTYLPITLIVLELCVRLGFIIAILLRRGEGSTSRLAWIVVVALIPIGGAVLYLLVGEVRLGTRRIRRKQEALRRLRSDIDYSPSFLPALQIDIDPIHAQIAALAESVGDTRPKSGNRIQLLGDTDLTIQALVEDIDQAESHCHLLYYIFLSDHSGIRIGEALMAAARRGVACRLLVDGVGSRDFLRSDLKRRVQEAGVQITTALPVNAFRALFARMDVRNHRKLSIIDGRIGYTGSQNIADASFAPKKRFAPWVDASVRIDGPVAHDLQRLFVEDWYLDTNEWLGDVLSVQPEPRPDGIVAQIIGTGPMSHSRAMRQVYDAAMHVAREELIITSPYFVPDEATMAALVTAARRNVETRLVLPARNDSPLVAAASRSYYESLLVAGTEVHEYQKGLLHAKTMTVDRDLAIVSSANLDRRSFDLNLEITVIVFDTDFASQLRFLQTSYIEDSVPVNPDRWARRRWPARLSQNAAGMLSPLL